MKLPFFI
ncbi:intracellular multiplication and human macrophage-killing family protein, partial [Yersinia pestis PY-11]